jgi:broad specificity phosphatase PhoE/predicted kinase
MKNKKLYIVMVGLPARGKSTIAGRLQDNLARDAIGTRIFNNGDLRRRLLRDDTSRPEFYDPANRHGVTERERIALMNLERARKYLQGAGTVAILDATNVSVKRRETVAKFLSDHPLLFIECINYDEDILEASIQRKILLPEFRGLEKARAVESFKKRIDYYYSIYRPLADERNFVKIDSLNNRILQESLQDDIPYFERIRDFLVTDSVKSLFLIRHGETCFNLENRIGGDSPLTQKGIEQGKALGRFFQNKRIPIIFTSEKVRTIQTAEPIKALQEDCIIIPLKEFNEIDSGACECMSYEEIRAKMPYVHQARSRDKYNYIYPGGEGYATMKERIDRGIKKALYLSTSRENVMIIGHRAVNRMILSHFLYRRTEDVPYIYVPQDKFYHIVATQDKKVFELKRFEGLRKASA